MAGGTRSRLRRTLSLAGVAAAYVSGIGSVVLVFVILGVRPDNFARWTVSPVGVAIIVAGVLLGAWEWRRR